MGVNDYGAATSPLDAPPLGGPGGWAESVSAVLDGSDETVDSRIAVATADLGARITRPNIDDRLVEQWNGSAWSVVDYDSGWRNATGLLVNGWTEEAPNVGSGGVSRIRRKGDIVQFNMIVGGVSATSNTVLQLLGTGFSPLSQQRSNWTVVEGIKSPPYTQSVEFAEYSEVADGLGTGSRSPLVWLYGQVACEATIPTSLPGTLYTPAPQ